MTAANNANLGHRTLWVWAGSVAFSAATTVLAILLITGCAGDRSGGPNKPEAVVPVPTVSEPLSGKQPTAEMPATSVARSADGGAASPARGLPKVDFVRPWPPQTALRLDYAPDANPPGFLELSRFTAGRKVQERLRRILVAELSRYPADLQGMPDAIMIGSTLTHTGRSVGAAHMLGMVFIAAGDQDAGALTDAHVVRALHHEIAHSLLDVHGDKFDAKRFRELLPTGFTYVADQNPVAEQEPFAPGNDSPTLELLNDGFLVPWAKHSINEDFCSYSEVLLQRPDYLLDLFAANSVVGRKARVVRDFYIAIDARFASMFRTSGK